MAPASSSHKLRVNRRRGPRNSSTGTDHLPLGQWYYCKDHPTFIRTDRYELNRHYKDFHPGQARPAKNSAELEAHTLNTIEAVIIFGVDVIEAFVEKHGPEKEPKAAEEATSANETEVKAKNENYIEGEVKIKKEDVDESEDSMMTD